MEYTSWLINSTILVVPHSSNRPLDPEPPAASRPAADDGRRQQTTCRGERFRIYLSDAEIHRRVVELAAEISRDYQGKRPVLVGVLNGAFIFLADLMRELTIDCEVDFVKLSSYGDEKITSGAVKDLKTVDADLKGRHVLVVEDIVDTGLSMEYLVGRLRQLSPASIATVALLHKYEATVADITLDYAGFRIENLFVVGYGLDYAQEGRNLRHIYIQETD